MVYISICYNERIDTFKICASVLTLVCHKLPLSEYFQEINSLDIISLRQRSCAKGTESLNNPEHLVEKSINIKKRETSPGLLVFLKHHRHLKIFYRMTSKSLLIFNISTC